jgi:Uma2 family endonuclease
LAVTFSRKPSAVDAVFNGHYPFGMPGLTIELPPQASQTSQNLRRWEELLEDPVLANVEGRIETDRHGHIIMSPPPGADHGSYQSEIAFYLRSLIPEGRVITECPISTADGVKAADVAWASPECLCELGKRALFPRCPEIAVEVLSPCNTVPEMNEKKSLYFDAGAREVWTCSESGAMSFYFGEGQIPASAICPKFPKQIQLR